MIVFEIWIYEYTLHRWPLQTTLPHYMYVRWYLLLFFVVILDDASVEEARAQVWIYIDFTQPQRVLEMLPWLQSDTPFVTWLRTRLHAVALFVHLICIGLGVTFYIQLNTIYVQLSTILCIDMQVGKLVQLY